MAMFLSAASGIHMWRARAACLFARHEAPMYQFVYHHSIVQGTLYKGLCITYAMLSYY